MTLGYFCLQPIQNLYITGSLIIDNKRSNGPSSRIFHTRPFLIREKAFREMKKDVGMTTAQKSKETRRMESLFCISSQQSLHIRRVASDYSVVMYVHVGIVGWIYRTKIPSFLFPYFFVQWSSLHLFSFHEMLFPLLVPGLFFLSFMVLAMYRVHSSMCMQGQMKEE